MRSRRSSEDGELRSACRTRLGASLVAICVATAAGTVLFVNIPFLRQHLAIGMIASGVVGLVLMLFRRRFSGEVTAEEVLLFYRSPRYWGLNVLVTTWLTFVLVLVFSPGAIALPKFIKAKAPEPVQTEGTVFPPLKVSAVILRGSRSSAVIDNKTVRLGERINGVTVVEIFEDGVVVELNGERKTVLRAAIQPLRFSKNQNS